VQVIIGIPKEIKEDEYRVAIVPVGVKELTERGHAVLIETGAGTGSGISDSEYRLAGARIMRSARELYKKAGLVFKVKEPLESEYRLLKKGQIVFTYFHFAANRKLTLAMIKTGIVAIAYETIEDGQGGLPILTPMSEVAGKMSIQEGAKYLERPMMGRGILLGGIPGVEPANVLIIGGGVVGTNAAKVAAGLGARVTVLDVNLERLRYLDDVMPKNVTTLKSDRFNLLAKLREADLVIGAVLIEGARAPVLVRRKDLKLMKQGSVIVDVAVDQGGCVETSRPTTHSNPVFTVDGVIHYCVTNMPGAVGRTSTYGLTNVTLHYAISLAEKGLKRACREDKGLKHGINIIGGKVVNKAVAQAFNMKCCDVNEILRSLK